MGPGSILQERRHSQLEDITAENGAWPHFLHENVPKNKSSLSSLGAVPKATFLPFTWL
jgi:hypothetical protein